MPHGVVFVAGTGYPLVDDGRLLGAALRLEHEPRDNAYYVEYDDDL